MKGLKYRLFVFAVFIWQLQGLFAQLRLDNPPKDNAFIARNISTNKAYVTIKGDVTDPAYSALRINIYQDKILKSSYNFAFNVAQNITSFSQKVDLTAGKYFYTIEYKLSGTASYTKIIDGIMVGDAYLIQGQSNAVAANYVNLSINYSKAYNDTFIKSFGNSYPSSVNVVGDTSWCMANGEKAYYTGSVGQWPLVLAKTLLDSFGIPICLINGAVGGTLITQHVSTFGNPEDLNSIYGRLLYRTRKAGLENNIRGILYFQGESDGSNATLHDSLFKLVYTSWNKDYRGFKKLYVVQVRGMGCGRPSIQLREYQRQFGFSLPKCTVISSNGLNNHDGCHYGFVNGYELLGKQLAALVSRDLYQSKITQNIDPPNIKSCYYSNASQDEITINMQNPTDIIDTDILFQNIFRVEGDNTVTITNGFIRNNKVVIQLNKSSCKITGLTYDSNNGTQPWVKNALKMGLISCYNLPIFKHLVQSFYSGCKKAIITIGEDSIPGYKYLWKRLATKQTFTTARIKIKGDSVEQFSLIVTYGVNACKLKDTLIVYMSPDPVAIPKLGNNQTICMHDSLLLKPDYFGYSQFKWVSSLNTISYNSNYIVSKAEKVVLTATSNKQCIYKDSVVFGISSPQVSLPANIIICTNTDTLISLPNTFMSYKWNTISGTNQFRAEAGIITVEVINNLGCKASDSTEVKSFPTLPKPAIIEKICGNESKLIGQPLPFKSWYYRNSQVAGGLTVYPDKTYPVLLIDSNNCMVNDTIRTTAILVPLFTLGNDTGYCKGKSLDMVLPFNMISYYLNNVPLNDNIVSIATEGNYIAIITNKNKCKYADTINITEYALPDLSDFHDTVLCIDSSWQPTFFNKINYTINASPVPQNFVFKLAGAFSIKAINQYQCNSEKTIHIVLKDCNTTAIKNDQKEVVKIYPNPVSTILNIMYPFKSETYADIHNMEGQLILSIPLEYGIQAIDLIAISPGTYFISIDGTRYLIMKI